MNITRSFSQDWDDERDAQFFRLAVDLFPADFCLGASVLLASYDADEALTPAAASTATAASLPAQRSAAPVGPAGSSQR